MAIVLDASAIIAFLRDESGAQLVEENFQRERGQTFVHALNLCEIYYDFYRANGQETAEAAIADLVRLGVQERSDMEPGFWRAMGRLKAMYRRVSLADCSALTLANRLGATLISADRHELEPLAAQGICQLEFIR